MKYAGERFYQEQPNYRARIILAVLLAIAIWTVLLLVYAWAGVFAR